MQNRAVIRLLAILFALACLYQLSFTFITSKVRREAREYSGGDLQKEFDYLDSLSGETVYNLGIIKYTFRDCQEREINLGLDLKGGMNVILEVSVVDIVRALSGYSADTTFNKAIAKALEMQKNSQDDFISLFGNAFETIDPNAKLAAIFSTVELRDRITFNSTNEQVLDVLRGEADAAIGNSFNILRSRIDRFGVTQPNIQRLEAQGRILIELPGVKDQARVRKLLQGTANLEFWETYENSEIYGALVKANEVIKGLEGALDTVKAETSEEPVVEDTVSTTGDTSKSELALLEELEKDTTATDSLQGAEFLKNYPLFKVLAPSVGQNNELMPGAIIGRAKYSDTATVNRYLDIKQVRALFPRNLRFVWGFKPPKWDESQSVFELYAIKITTRDGRAPLDGGSVVNARDEFGQGQATAEVTMSMNAEGSKTWARITRDNVGKVVAIVLDNYVYSAPRVNQEITGGNSQITGDFTIEEAKDLANVLKSGKMPAPAHIVEEAIVGPSLGQEAINSGFSSFALAFVLVLVYMLFYYSRNAGLVANVALVVNVFFLIGVLASIQAVLTLPGIAGIVLTMGMAVDANVIIYERIREELAAGKGIKLAVKDGYRHAYSAIIDGNVTTLLTGVILLIFGTGPIKGFATTLIIGILTSLFTAIFISRLIFERMMDKNKEIMFVSPFAANILRNPRVPFIETRKIAYAFSIIFIVAGLISLLTRGLSYGVDFTGGRTYVVRFDENVKTADIANLLESQYGHAPEVKTFGSENQVKIVTKYRITESDTAVDADVENKLYTGLKPLLGDDVTKEVFMEKYRQSSQKVGPTIADDIKWQAALAVLFSIIGIFLYILIRFRNWQFGLGAVASLVHDVLIVIGIYSLLWGYLPFSLEIDQAFIAAILTVLGYSINDTVIIFDRVREYVGLHPKGDAKETINNALNSTLGRTMNTTLTTLVVLVAIFLFGGEVMRGFIFALLVGISFGTFSSVYVASPILYETIKKKGLKALKGIRRE